MASGRKERRNTLLGIAFLVPNILGVLTFVVFPVLFAIMLAFTNWDLRRHNMFKDNPLEFVGVENFYRLITEAGFFQYFGNTLFLMMGIPFGIAAALGSAMMLSQDTRGGGGKVYAWLIASAVMVVSAAMLAVVGLGGTAMAILLVGLACAALIMGMGGGVTVYRTLFYTPHFTAGVATFLLWKKLYSPEDGPINASISPVLEKISQILHNLSPAVPQAFMVVGLAVVLLLFAWGAKKMRQMWVDGDLGSGAAVLPITFMLIPVVVAMFWSQLGSLSAEETAFVTGKGAAGTDSLNRALTFFEQYRGLITRTVVILSVAVLGWHGYQATRRGRDFDSTAMNGAGSGLVLGLAVMVGMFVMLGLAAVAFHLPWLAATPVGNPVLETPGWINDYDWAKPAIMIMAFWGAIGSNNMLLYLAALTNVPGELYEAADIDGAGRFQRFWNVTWPQLAPTTFFIFVMSTIHGLQGGFEMARTMTQGGPAGSTTTVSYFIYKEGFETGRLSFSAGIAWALFLLVFGVTMFNWKFGNRYVND